MSKSAENADHAFRRCGPPSAGSQAPLVDVTFIVPFTRQVGVKSESERSLKVTLLPIKIATEN